MTKASTMEIPMVLTIASSLIYFLVSPFTKTHPNSLLGRAFQLIYLFKKLGCVKDHIFLTWAQYNVNPFFIFVLPLTPLSPSFYSFPGSQEWIKGGDENG
jgi:hypothetical protein